MSKNIKIPAGILPEIKNFGCGPSAIKNEHVAKLAASSRLGTSHRQAPVRNLVGYCQSQTAELFDLPADYQVVLGNGGATTFWAVASASLIKQQSCHAVFGAFGEKFAKTTQQAPFLMDPIVVRGGFSQRTAGDRKDQGATKQDSASSPFPPASELAVLDQAYPGVDSYCWPHHETSTGVISPVKRVPHTDEGALMLVDATSIAGGVPVDLTQVDCYYFSLQKCFAADGGLWVSLVSPAAQARAAEVLAAPERFSLPGTSRWIPEILDFSKALKNSAKQQTLNTPAVATLELWAAQLEWFSQLGGLTAVAERCRHSSQVLYDWADSSQRPWVTPYVSRAEERSPVVVTLDFASQVDTHWLLSQLRANGILDLDSYRSLGRNQLRCSCFPTISPADTQALTACLDYLVERITA